MLEISQRSLATRVGVHINTIHRLEKGHAGPPNLLLAKRIAEVLESDVATLFPELLRTSAA